MPARKPVKLNLKYLYILTMIKLVNIILSLLCIIFIFIIFYSKQNRENFNTTSTNIKCSGQLTTATQNNFYYIENYSFCADPLPLT